MNQKQVHPYKEILSQAKASQIGWRVSKAETSEQTAPDSQSSKDANWSCAALQRVWTNSLHPTHMILSDACGPSGIPTL